MAVHITRIASAALANELRPSNTESPIAPASAPRNSSRMHPSSSSGSAKEAQACPSRSHSLSTVNRMALGLLAAERVPKTGGLGAAGSPAHPPSMGNWMERREKKAVAKTVSKAQEFLFHFHRGKDLLVRFLSCSPPVALVSGPATLFRSS